MESINIVNIPSATDDGKIILVINISPTKFILDTSSYCDTDMVFPYRLIYVRIENFEDISVDVCVDMIKKLNVITDRVCIYHLDKRGGINDLLKFINRLDFPNTIVMNDINNTYIRSEIDLKSPVNVLKFINFKYTDHSELQSKYLGNLDNKNSYIIIWIRNNNPNLLCQTWFQYSVNILFDCIKGRLRQLSGTCYLNAVVNGFILSKSVRNIILNGMKDLLFDYKTPLNLDICEKKLERYFFRLFYNALCSKEPLRKTITPYDDIMIEYSKLYANPTADGTITGIGGDPLQTLDNITKYLNDIFTALTGSYEYIFYPKEIWPGEKIQMLRYIDDIEYKLQFVIISLIKTSIAHAIIGFICDGVYKIYDSSLGLVTNFDWTNPDNFITLTSIYSKYKYIDSYISSALYIDTRAIVNKSTRELCDDL